MKVRVTFFGRLREVVGDRATEVRVDGGPPSVAEVAARLREQRPELADHLDAAAFAVDDRLVDADRTLRSGEELDVLPPVSGG